ncbi:MAG: thioredoxin domain-containing protein [Myxococcota bacterium]|nr:thioredoxin domain-containing protein [Myxococcota bacterium]
MPIDNGDAPINTDPSDSDTATDTEPVDTEEEADFCNSDAYAAFLAAVPHVFNNADAPYLGNSVDPMVVITGFSYFRCPHCHNAAVLLDELMADPEYAAHVAYYFRHYSLSMTPGSIGYSSHLAAYAAHMQGKFWYLHDWMFSQYDEALGQYTYKIEDVFRVAADGGLDMGVFDADYNSDAGVAQLVFDKAEGKDAGMTGTPSLFVNGVKIKPWRNTPKVVDCLLEDSYFNAHNGE